MKPTDKTPADTDRAYLLRCWREGAAWRFSLEPVSPQSQRRGFATLEAMVAFLRDEFQQEPSNVPFADLALCPPHPLKKWGRRGSQTL